MAGALDTATQRAQELGQQNPVVEVGISGVEQSINDIAAIQREINNLRGRDVGIRIVGTAVGAVGGGVMRFHEGGYVPGPRGQEIAAVLQAPTYSPTTVESACIGPIGDCRSRRVLPL